MMVWPSANKNSVTRDAMKPATPVTKYVATDTPPSKPKRKPPLQRRAEKLIHSNAGHGGPSAINGGSTSLLSAIARAQVRVESMNPECFDDESVLRSVLLNELDEHSQVLFKQLCMLNYGIQLVRFLVEN